ncbi:ABC1 kinase family protein [Prochlorothrix hollandica]|nr:AarF/ABC1/UbiB kinase family protein [Prochlorothrix hollandica]
MLPPPYSLAEAKSGADPLPNVTLSPPRFPSLPPATDRPGIAVTRHADSWSRGHYSKTTRFLRIWAFVLRFLAELWYNGKHWTYAGGFTPEKLIQRQRRQAIWIRETMLRLGPTFIKLGQFFSTRADIFPSHYVEELSQLQDRVPAFSYAQVEETLQKDLGKEILTLFSEFDPIPLAAASLGQVHRATLHTGESVVVKIQRPGLQRLFAIDLAILKGITHFFQRHPQWGRDRDWLGIYEECRRILWEEIDYINEGRNADTFRRNFRNRPWAKVPRIYWRYASHRVLTLEYLPGIKISDYEALDAAGLDRSLLARLNAKAYLHQILDDGLFHADPHPGNLAVSPDGALIFYDFGMMGRLRSDVRSKVLDTFFGVAQKDANRVIDALIDLEALVPTGDLSPVRRSIQYLLDNFMDKPLEAQSITAITEDLYDIAYDRPFRFPATFTFVMRAFTSLEGVGKGLDPHFNFLEVAQPFALDIMADGNSAYSNDFLGQLSRQAAQASNTAFGLPRRLEDTLGKLEQGDIRVRVRSSETERLLRQMTLTQMSTNYAVLSGSSLIASTLLITNGQVPLAVPLLLLTAVLGTAFVRLNLRLRRLDRFFKESD